MSETTPEAAVAATLSALDETVRLAVAAGTLPSDITIILSDRAPAAAWHDGVRLFPPIGR